MVAGRHWEAIAREIGYRPTDVKNRVQQIVDAIVANRSKVTADVTALPGATEGYVVLTAEAVEENALRMAGRL
jgi:serine/threonine-protein kinase HipA